MNTIRASNRERGAVLIVTLLFLVILTMLGVTAMTSTTLEERMSGNTRDSAIALQSAEAALRDARRDINSIEITGSKKRQTPIHISQFGTGAAGSCNSGGIYAGLCEPALMSDGTVYNPKAPSYLPELDLTDANKLKANSAGPSVEYGTFTGAEALAKSVGGIAPAQPRYIVEGFCLQALDESIGAGGCGFPFYRITARGWGRNPNTQITLQEVFLSI